MDDKAIQEQFTEAFNRLNIQHDQAIQPSPELEAELAFICDSSTKTAIQETVQDAQNQGLTYGEFQEQFTSLIENHSIPASSLSQSRQVSHDVIHKLESLRKFLPEEGIEILSNWINQIQSGNLYSEQTSASTVEELRAKDIVLLQEFENDYNEAKRQIRIMADEILSLRSKESKGNKTFEDATVPMSPVIKIPLENIDSLEFDIFEIVQEHGQMVAMEAIASNILKQWNISEKLSINGDLLSRAINELGSGYIESNPYHNVIHATDVMQGSHLFLRNTELIEIAQLEDIHIFSFLFAAFIHDYKHPGVNNMYLQNTKDPIAIRYNDQSVLESYHLGQAFKTLRDPDVDIFSGLTPEVYKTSRNLIIECVLATDMSRHFAMTADAPDKLQAPIENRTFVLKYLVHGVDIGNPIRPAKACHRWAEKVLEEFFAQGDREKAQGLPVSMLCDRDTVTLPKSQIGFINGVVLPQFLVIEKTLAGAKIFVEGIRSNLEKWEEEQATETSAQV